MSKLSSASLTLCLVLAASSVGAQPADKSLPAGDWRSEVAADFATPINGCAIGDVDSARPGNEIVAALQDGRIMLIARDKGAWTSQEIGRSAKSEAIIRATVGMARGMGFRTVAEGIETPAQRDFVAALGCDVLQGWLFGRPNPASAYDVAATTPAAAAHATAAA